MTYVFQISTSVCLRLAPLVLHVWMESTSLRVFVPRAEQDQNAKQVCAVKIVCTKRTASLKVGEL